LLINYVPDWRWLLARSDTSWYPSARLFRQSASRSWPELLALVRGELRRLAAHGT
jgi:hypothetical protein